MKKILICIVLLSQFICGYAQDKKINPPSKFIGLLNIQFGGVRNGEYKYDGAPFTGFWESEVGSITGYYKNSVPVGVWSCYDSFGYLVATCDLLLGGEFESVGYSLGAIYYKIKGVYTLKENYVKMSRVSSKYYDILGNEVTIDDIRTTKSSSFFGTIENDCEYHGCLNYLQNGKFTIGFCIYEKLKDGKYKAIAKTCTYGKLLEGDKFANIEYKNFYGDYEVKFEGNKLLLFKKSSTQEPTCVFTDFVLAEDVEPNTPTE